MLFYDTNDDGEIQVTEAEAVTGTMDVNGEFLTTHYFDRIADLTGIEAFINITALLCYDNLLTTLDVSQNSNLRWLYCHFNNLTSLDISENHVLGCFQCQNNELTYLDVRNRYYNIFAVFNSTDNPNLTCIFVDDTEYMETNWGDYIDPNSTFVETQAACDAIGVNEELFEQIKIFPNPVKDSLTIKLSTTVSNKTIIKVSTILGKQIRTKKVSRDNKIIIDTSSLSQGVYLISIFQNNKVLTKKIIKL